ncbi:hypothetical protein HYPSUDRAFT_838186 [Hypholoma sublateritium FD-334 SS-4]|uniref:Uncharacterized protein n=1 Tax=Hypholoma sublateritium (strain FD-334 SS-4) TaxID=945553 RepID=A0A0D2M9R1_HYPSF|nr:hypothetical protein HYPSUDRAFT_838186 [Hypholoma sublateritium FD-334 SS-4]
MSALRSMHWHLLPHPLIQAHYARCMMPVRMPVRLRCFAQYTAVPARPNGCACYLERVRVHTGEFWPAPADWPSHEGSDPREWRGRCASLIWRGYFCQGYGRPQRAGGPPHSAVVSHDMCCSKSFFCRRLECLGVRALWTHDRLSSTTQRWSLPPNGARGALLVRLSFRQLADGYSRFSGHLAYIKIGAQK